MERRGGIKSSDFVSPTAKSSSSSASNPSKWGWAAVGEAEMWWRRREKRERRANRYRKASPLGRKRERGEMRRDEEDLFAIVD